MRYKSGVTLVTETHRDKVNRLKKVTHKRVDFLIYLETTRFIFPSFCAVPKEEVSVYPESLANLIEHFALTYEANKLYLLRYSMETFLCREILGNSTMIAWKKQKDFYDDYFKVVPVNSLSELMYGETILFIYGDTMLVPKNKKITNNINKLREIYNEKKGN